MTKRKAKADEPQADLASPSGDDTPESLGFALRLESGRALLELRDRALGRGISLGRLELEIPNVKFPFDVTGGAERFHSTRCKLRALVLSLSHDALRAQLERPSVAEAGFANLEAQPENGALTVSGDFRFSAGSTPFSFAMAPVIMGPRELGLLPFDERVFGPCPLPAARLPWLLLQALGGLPLRSNEPVFDVVALSVRELLPRFGWKIPDTQEVGLIQAEITKTGWIVACGERLLDESKSSSRVSFAVEARAPFEELEKLVYAGKDAAAFRRYREHIDEEVPHRFAVRRYLQLAAAHEDRYEDGRSVAEEALVHDAGNTDALLYMGHYALYEGNPKGAVRAFQEAAARLWADKSDRAAALADVTAARIALTLDPDLARTSLMRTLKKRKSDVRALREWFRLERDAADLKAATSAGEKLLRTLPDNERFPIHLELGELLLDHDLRKAKLHAERALRSRMDDPGATRLVARIFARSGDAPRAVRYLSRLAERLIAAGSIAQAAALESEVAELLERTSSEPGFDPRVLLSRYQRILTLDQTHRPAMRRAAELAYELGETSVAKRWYEELAEDSDVGARTEAAFRLGELALDDGREPDAEASFIAALSYGPLGERAYQRLREIYRHRKDTRAALELEIRMAELAQEPAQQLAHHLHAADLAEASGAGETSVRHLQAALAISPADAALKRRLIEATARHSGHERIEALLAAWAPNEHEPHTRAEWYLELANLRENKGDLPGAKAALDAAIASDPTSSEANEALYSLCQRLNEPYGAFAALGNLARYRNSSDEATAEIRITQAELLAGPLERRDEARAYLLRALADVPHHVRGLKLLGELAEEARDFAMASDAWRRYLETGAEDGRELALRSLGRLARERGDLQEQFNYLFELWQLNQEASVFDEMREVLKDRGDFGRLVLLLRDAAAATSGERAQEYRWQTALVLRDSVGDWESARQELWPMASSAEHHGELARRALVELAEDEGRPDLLAQALEACLQFSDEAATGPLKLSIARAYREAGDSNAASASYRWLLDHDGAPGRDEALRYIAEEAENAGNSELAFRYQLERFRAGATDALPSLVRVTEQVPTARLIESVALLDKLPSRYVLEVAGRLDAEGYASEAVAAIEAAAAHIGEPEQRAELVRTVAQLQEQSLGRPQLAIATLRAELGRGGDPDVYAPAIAQLIERAGTPAQRAELALERAYASGEPAAMWRALEALLAVEPESDDAQRAREEQLGALFHKLALLPELRDRVAPFLLSDRARLVVTDDRRAELLLALHAEAPLGSAELERVVALLHSAGERERAHALLGELYERAPEDEAAFAAWRDSAANPEAERRCDAVRLERLEAQYRAENATLPLAKVLLDAHASGFASDAALTEARELFALAGEWSRALSLAVTVTERTPDDGSAWTRRAELALAAAEPAAVVTTLEALSEALGAGALHGDFDAASLTRRFGHALATAGHAREAETLFTAMLAQNPADEDAYAALGRLLEETPRALLGFAKARSDVLQDESAETQAAALRDLLRIAERCHDDDEVFATYAKLAALDAIMGSDVEAAFSLVAAHHERLSFVWDWAEEHMMGLGIEQRRRVATICELVDDEAADDIRASLLASLPHTERSEAETTYLIRRMQRTGQADLALQTLGMMAFDDIVASVSLRGLWLELAETLADAGAALRMRAALAASADADFGARLELAVALLAAHEDERAFALLEALTDEPEFDQDPRAATLRQSFRAMLYRHARDAVDAAPERALGWAERLLREAPDSEEAWLLSVDAATRSGHDARLISLLEGRPLGHAHMLVLADAYERAGRMADAAAELERAHGLSHDRTLLDRAFALLERGDDSTALADALLRHAAGQPDETAMLARAQTIYASLGDELNAAALSTKLFEADPANDAFFARERQRVEAAEDAHALVRVLERRLGVARDEERYALVRALARTLIEKLFAYDDAEALLGRHTDSEHARDTLLYGLFDELGDEQRATSLAKKLFRANPANATDYQRYRARVEQGGSVIDLFELLELRLDALPPEERAGVAQEAARLAYDRLHDLEAAEAALRKAYPDELDFTNEALALADELHHHERAAELTRRAFELTPTDDVAYQRYRIQLEAEQNPAAIVEMLALRAQALPDEGRLSVTLEAARIALDKAKLPERAEQLLLSLPAELGSDPQALQLRIATALRLGRDAEALGLLKGLALSAQDPADKLSLLRQAGRIAERLGLGAEAAALWVAALDVMVTPEELAKRGQHLPALDSSGRARALALLLDHLQGQEQHEATIALSALSEDEGDLQRALELARRALAHDPEAQPLRERVAGLLERMGQTESLLSLLGEQHATCLDRAERYRLAMDIARRAEHDAGDREQAEHFYRQAAKDDPTQRAPLTELLRLYTARGATAERCDAAEQLIALLAPGAERGEACNQLGEWRSERGETDKAALAYLHAFADGVATAAGRRAVRAAAKRGQYIDEAIRSFEHLGETLSGDERRECWREAAAIIAEAKQDYVRAAQVLRRALQDTGAPPSREDTMRLVEWLERGGALRAALDELLGAIDREEREDNRSLMLRRASDLAERTGTAEARVLVFQRKVADKRLTVADQITFANVLMAEGSNVEAQRVLTAALGSATSDGDRAIIAQALLDAGQIDVLLQPLLDDHGPTRGESLCRAARMCERTGDVDRAYALYRETLALEGAKLDEADLGHIVMLAERRGDGEMLTDAYLRLAESSADPEKRAGAYLAMARLWHGRSDSARAEDCLRQSLHIAPTSPVARESRALLARMLVEQGRASEQPALLAELEVSLDPQDLQWQLKAARILADTDLGAARRVLEALAPHDEEAFWTLLDIESDKSEDERVVRMLLARMDADLPVNDALWLLRGANHAREANIAAAEARLLEALVALGGAEANSFARLAELAKARQDLSTAYTWLSREADLRSDPSERANALHSAAELGLSLGKEAEAKAQLEQAFNLAPTLTPVLNALFALYQRSRDYERMMMVGERIIIVDPNATQPQSFYLVLAEAAQATRSEPARVFELYQLAAAAAALPLEALERAAAAAGAAGHDAEQLELEEERLSHIAATAADYLRLGNIARDRLQDRQRAERYFRMARSIDAQAPGPIASLAAALAPQRDKAQEAIALYRELLVKTPTDPEPYRLLARLYGQQQDVDRTFIYYDALRALDPSDEEAERFVTASQQVLPELPPRGLGKGELGTIADPGMLSVIQQFYGPLAAQAELLYTSDLAKIGLSDADMVALDQGPGRRLAVVMQRMGGRALEVLTYRAKVAGKDAIIEPGAPARLILSSDVFDMPPRAQTFLICRALAFLSLGHLLPNRLPHPDMATLLALLAKRFSPALEVPNVPADRAAFVVERFRAVTPDESWVGHAEMARNFATTIMLDGDKHSRELSAWVRSGERTADRWALLMAGDLSAAFAAQKRLAGARTAPLPASGKDRLSAIAARLDLLDLLSFAVSDGYLAVRQALGIMLKR